MIPYFSRAKARIRSFSLVLTVLFVLTVFSFVRPVSANTTIYVPGTFKQSTARAMLSTINEFRADPNAWQLNRNEERVVIGSRAALSYDYNLEQIAMQRAVEIALSFDHTRPDGTSWSSITINGTSSNAENIAIGSYDFDAFECWCENDCTYDYQGHRRAMQNANYSAIGIAHFVYNGVHCWVQEFRRTNSGASATAALDGEGGAYVPVDMSRFDWYVSASPKNITGYYGDSRDLPEVTVGAKCNVEGCETWAGPGIVLDEGDYDVLWSADDPDMISIEDGKITFEKAGTTNLMITAYNGDLNMSITVPVTVSACPISDDSIDISIPDVRYTGSARTPTPVISRNGVTLVRGVDYTLGSYSNNTDVGSSGYYGPRVAITGIGNYSGTTSASFNILPMNISNCTIGAIEDQVYRRSYGCQPTVAVSYNGQEFSVYDYDLSYSNNTSVGTGSVTITGRGNLTGSVTRTFTILPRDISNCRVYIEDYRLTYTGSPLTPSVEVTDNGTVLTENVDYTVSYTDNVNPGTGYGVVTGIGNYTGSGQDWFQINPTTTPRPTSSGGSSSGSGSSGSGSSSSGSSSSGSGSSYSGSSSSSGSGSSSSGSSYSGGGYSSGSSSAATPTLPPYTPGATSSEPGVAGFVERLYTIALGRASDPSGKANWIAAITERGNTGADAARGFLYSSEFLNRGYSNGDFVTILYRTFFDREPDQNGYNAWVNALNSGASKQDVIEGFINSTEWANLCVFYGIAGGGTGVPSVEVEPSQGTIDFCTRLYTTCLNRSADSNGLMAWARQLANQRDTGTGAARGFFFSSEFLGQNVSNGEYVTRLYRTFMGREPDSAGYNAWVSQLNAGVSREEVFNGFAQSQEFTQICAQYGIIRGS